MAQKPLFNVSKRSDKKRNVEILDSRGKRVKVASTEQISSSSFVNAVTRAKSMSERILGDVLDRLELVTDEEEIDDWAELAAENGIAAIDSETSGLHAYKDKLAGICLYTYGSKGIYIPIGHISNMTKMPLKENVDKEFIKDVLEWLVEDCEVKFVYHNAKFEMNFLYWHLGVDMGQPYWDTFIGAVMLNENESHNLENWHSKYIKQEEESAEKARFGQLFKGIPFTLVPPDVGYMYAGYDPIMTMEIYDFQKKFLDTEYKECRESGLERVAWVFRNIEMPLIRVLFDMEVRGVTLNTERLAKIRTQYEKQLKKAENELYELLNTYTDEIDDFRINYPNEYEKIPKNSNGELTPNIASTQQMAYIIYDILKIESPDKKSPRGTGDKILQAIDHPFVKLLQNFRKNNKMLTTYTTYDKWIAEQDGRIHTNYKQTGAKTGRMSSEDPSIMNIPARGDAKIMRTVFEAREGFKLIGSDYSQQEPRLLAFLSQDRDMLKAYKDGKDLYAYLGSVMYGVPYEDCLEFDSDGNVNVEGERRRFTMKSILLGLMYGRQEASIAEQTGMTTKEARSFIKRFFSMFPKISETVATVQNHAREYGYVETLVGRKRRLPDMQLDPIEITTTGEGKAAGVDIFNFDTADETEYVPEDVWEYYNHEYSKAWGFKQKMEIREAAKKEGYEIKDNGGYIAEAERQCLNSVIQGSAADLTKLAMIKIHNDKKMKEFGFHLLIPVHDELIGEAPEEVAEEAGERLSYLMKKASDEMLEIADSGREKIPMKCDVEISHYWYQSEFEGVKI